MLTQLPTIAIDMLSVSAPGAAAVEVMTLCADCVLLPMVCYLLSDGCRREIQCFCCSWTKERKREYVCVCVLVSVLSLPDKTWTAKKSGSLQRRSILGVLALSASVSAVEVADVAVRLYCTRTAERKRVKEEDALSCLSSSKHTLPAPAEQHHQT